jgi:anti-sigma B factor antagonist
VSTDDQATNRREARRRDLDCALVLAVQGEVDMLTANLLWEEGERALTDGATPPARPVVLDLTAVEFLDSHGIAALVRLAESARRRGRPLSAVVADGQAIRRPIELCGLDRVVPVHAELGAAVADR